MNHEDGLTPERREHLRVRLLVVSTHTSRRLGATVDTFCGAISDFFSGIDKATVERELEHLESLGLVDEVEPAFSLDVRRFAWSAKGREWLAQRGM
jgi:hypothetical protein